MGTSIILALMIHGITAPLTPIAGNEEWEEPPQVQKAPGYHPLLQFKRELTFIFVTPKMICEGKYQVQGGHYFFKTLRASELENADVAKIIADMPPDAGHQFAVNYAKSMQNFEADYDDDAGALHLTYPVDGMPKTFQLYPYTAGDDQLISMVGDNERGVQGLWRAPEPFPDMLDAKTRYRIGGLEGLEKFFQEAGQSDAAQFGIIDLRVDKTFRNHAIIGRWRKEGSTVTLIVPPDEIHLTLSPNGQKLTSRGKIVYVRN